MFDAVRFQNYKCLADVTIELGQMTLLVGANASGKSSVLDGLYLLCQLAVRQSGEPHPMHRVGTVFSGSNSPERLRTSGRTTAIRIEASIDKDASRTVALAVTAERPPGSNGVGFVVDMGFEDGSSRSVSGSSMPPDVHAFFRDLEGRGFGQVVRLRLDAGKVAGFAPDSEQPRVDHDGAGTAAVIAWLAEQRDGRLDDIEKDLRRVIPRARRLVPRRAQREQQLGRLFALEMDGAKEPIPADLLSEGTLLTIGLLTVLHGRPTPKLVLLDDIDRALHPIAQKQLVACVKAMLEQHRDLQFVCTAHSPYVVDLFDADDVRVLRADAQGFAHARKLSEHPEWAKWKETLVPGEFWSYVGEDWLDAPAAAE